MPDVIIITSPGPPGPPGPSGSGSGGGGVGFPFSGSAVITGSLEILSSGSNNILTLTSQSNTLFQITNNTAGNLLEVNSFLNPFDLPIFYVSSSYQSEFRGPVSGSFTGSLLGTASYARQALSSSFAISSSYALSSSFATTASYALNAGTVPSLAQVTAVGATTTTTMGVGLLSSSIGGYPGSSLDLKGNAGFPSSIFNFSYEGNAGSCMLGQQDLRGEDDIIFQALPGSTGRFGVFEAYQSAGAVLGTGGNSSPIIFQIDRNERARLASNGNFLIGTSSDSGFKLDVNGSFRTTSTINANLANVTSSNVVYYNTASGLFTYGTINAGSGGGAVNKIIAGSSITISPESGVGDVTVSYAGGGGAFPFTGSAGISGSLDLNGPLNVDIRDFNINNDAIRQNAALESSSINLTTYSNQVGTVNIEWYADALWSQPSSITSGTNFNIEVDTTNTGLPFPSIGTKVFYSGSQSDSYNIPGYKFLGVVTSTSSYQTYYDEGFITIYRATVNASITTSSLSQQTYRFYNTGSELGTINLNGNTNINGNTTISGSIILSGSTTIGGNITAVNFFGNASTLTGILANPFTGSLLVSGSVNLNGNYIGSKLTLTGNELNIGTTNTAFKTINLGEIVTVQDVDFPTGTADQNTIIFNRNLGVQSDDIHTQINFDGRYWQYFAGPESYDAYDDTGNHYLKFTSGPSFSPSPFYDRFINLQFHTRPIGSNIAKGFSTDYNGSTYFNVTGSVSASAYYGNGATLSGVISNPFTGSFLITGSLGIIGPTSVNGPLSVTGSLTATGSVVITGSVSLTEGVNGVYISKGSGSRSTNLVLGDARALSTVSGTGTNGQNNIAIGSGSLIAATATFRNIALGNNVLPTITSNGSNNNIGIGFDVFTAGSTSVTNNIAIGNSASYATILGDNNIAIGTEALFSNQNSSNNIAIGLRAGRLATGAFNSIFMGTDAGANITSGDNNIAIGFEALKLLTSVGNNIAIGYQAMVSGSGAQDSIAIGSSALSKITTGDDNLAIGANALATITTATGNLAIGTDSMISSSATLASNNTSIGFQSLQNITGSNNVGIGYRVMQGFRSGSNNTVIGYNNVSGSDVSGSNNTIIGANVVLPDGVHNNRIIIADGRGTQIINTSGSITSISGSLNVTGSSAIFTLQPQDPLPTVNIPTGSFAVSSSIPAKPYFWDGSVWNALY